MNLKVEKASLAQTKADLLVVNLFEGVKNPGGATGAADDVLNGAITEFVIGKEGFDGKFGEFYLLPIVGECPFSKVLIVGLGEHSKFTYARLKELSMKTIAQIKKYKNVGKVSSILHGAGCAGLDAEKCAEVVAEGTIKGYFEFDKYKTEKNDKVSEFVILEPDADKYEKAVKGAKIGKIKAEAANFVRTLVTDSPQDITPLKLAEIAKQLNVSEVNVYTDIRGMKMGAFAAVAQGSPNAPQFIHMKYVPENPVKKVVLIGKGITFDSGGLDLKPPASMLNMKDDMTGAATVLAIMKYIKALNPKVEVHGLIAACENMPGASAYKPGDILTARNGKTIEVDNTDAEGRLTLADALCYASELEPDVIIDVATLTGACMVALGSVASGIMGNNDELVKRLIQIGNDEGEYFWELPMFEEYGLSLKSDIADMKNTGSRYGGASAAGMFLKNFVSGNPSWAHLDIAGTAFIDKPFKGLQKGSTGVAVDTLTEYLLSF
mgnify:CR=1 FL=1